MKRTQQYIRLQTIDRIIGISNLTLPYRTVPTENRNLKPPSAQIQITVLVRYGSDWSRFY